MVVSHLVRFWEPDLGPLEWQYELLTADRSEANESNYKSASPSSISAQAFLLHYLGYGLAEQSLLHKLACQARL